MQIFVLDKHPSYAAMYLTDCHLRKMIIETAQVLSTVYRLNGRENKRLYKSTHINHPAVAWTNRCYENLNWLLQYGLALVREYNYRFNKEHKSGEVIKYCNIYLLSTIQLGTEVDKRFVFIGPDTYKPEDHSVSSTVQAYRKYYAGKLQGWIDNDKSRLVKWTNRDKPDWLNIGDSNE